MALNLYLDDCSNSDLLADLLRQAGHRVARPTDDGVGLDGEDDQIHFGFAVAHGLAIITKNPADFKALHDVNPRHYGILAIYQDNDPARTSVCLRFLSSTCIATVLPQGDAPMKSSYQHLLVLLFLLLP